MSQPIHPDCVQVSFGEGVARLTINRPDCQNGLDSEIARRLRDAAVEIIHRNDIRVVLITGAGKRFCVGVNLDWLRPEEPGCDERMRETIERLNEFVTLLRQMRPIVVVAMQGAAAGGGFALMCAADYVLAQEGTLISTAYARIGGTPDCGTSYLLPRLVGERRALELLLLSEPIDCHMAQQLGLVQRVVGAADFDASVLQLVQRLSHGPAQAQAGIKRLVYASLDADLPTQLEQELAGMIAAYRDGEMSEGVMAFRQKRAPNFDIKPSRPA